MAEQEVPTKPENDDPVMAAIARIEGNVDKITGMLQAFFDELNEQRARLDAIDERISTELGDGV